MSTLKKKLHLLCIQGVYQTLLPKTTYNKYICPKKEKQQYIAVATVRMFKETCDFFSRLESLARKGTGTLELNVRTYCMLLVLALKNST